MSERGFLPFSKIKLMIASPEEIRSWSHGEVKKAETINYRTQKPEKDGLFCAKIFGPVKDYECLCGKYKGKRHAGTICDKCGVEVTTSYVRRERFGHIELASPVAHIWFLRNLPSKIATLLRLNIKNVERVVYLESYLLIEHPLNEEEEREFERSENAVPLKDSGWVKLSVVNEEEIEKISSSIDEKYEYGTGAEIIRDVLSRLDLKELLRKLKELAKPYSLSFEDLNEEVYKNYRKLYERIIKTIAKDFEALNLDFKNREELGLSLERAISDLILQKLYLDLKEGRLYQERVSEELETGKEALVKYYEGLREKLKLPVFEKIKEDVRATVMKEIPAQSMRKILNAIRVVEGFIKSGNKPEWMILEVLPVLPPELRPIIALESGRFATSDLNELYRRVINRNNRLKRLIESDAPELIIKSEKRMLQEAVDALIDNGKRGRQVVQNGRPLKSLTDFLKGKQGRFRQNLLGKRVDYSGRSVIVVGPELKMHQCGLPREMALELFKPFVYRRLVEKGYATTLKNAQRLVEQKAPEVWECLEEVVKQHPVLLNRAPTLHRPSIQAFEPVLVEGRAIKLHPLVCPPFNADFDGDQMAVHVPLGIEAQLESYILMLSTQNILSPAHGKPLTMPSQDMILGTYYLTAEPIKGRKGEGKVFSSKEEAIKAYELGVVDIHAKIYLKLNGKLVETTVGRVIFNSILPEGYPFINELVDKKKISSIVYDIYRKFGNEATADFLDRLKELGFEYSTKAGVSIGIEDLKVPKKKREIIEEALKESDEVIFQHREGAISSTERYNKMINIWSRVTNRVSEAMFEEIEKTKRLEGKKEFPGVFNPIYMMARSGARGNRDQIRQLAGMRGLMAKHSGEFIETPIVSNFREGLSVLEYFISTYGARKGLADTALRTSFAGYLTRRLVDVAQEIVITQEDCGTERGIEMSSIVESGEEILSLKDRIFGRVLAQDVKDPYTGETIAKKNQLVDDELAEKIVKAGVEKVKVRSPITCEASFGVCAMCYGMDLSQRRLVSVGEAVGIIAAQSIGEPGTQLTMRTFHIGGAATAESQESFVRSENEGRVKFFNLKLVKNREGKSINLSKSGGIAILDQKGRIIERHPVPHSAVILVEEGQKVEKGQKLAEWDPFNDFIIAEEGGTLELRDVALDVTVREERDILTGRSAITVSFLRPKDALLHSPKLVIRTEDGREITYDLPVNAILNVPTEKLREVYEACPTCSEDEGTVVKHRYIVLEDYKVSAGDFLAKVPKEKAKVRDIVGGLPRVEELFEARTPKNPAIISEIDGIVKVYEDADEIILFNLKTKETKKYSVSKDDTILVRHGQRVRKGQDLTEKGIKAQFDGQVRITGRGYKVLITNLETGIERSYFVPKGMQLRVSDGDRISAGEPITEGLPNPHEILRIKGVEELQKFLLKEVQLVYRSQGVNINDKHFEIIIRQMLRKRRILDPGDSRFVANEIVDREELEEEIKRIKEEGGKIPKSEVVLVGITEASRTSRSWISAASFQETPRVLTDASCEGKEDEIRGIKENVIIGNLIPAGTGIDLYKKVEVVEKKVRK